MVVRPTAILVCTLAIWAVAGEVGAQSLAGAALVKALQHGGYVIVMRHAHAPAGQPSVADADSENPAHERQLDQVGRDTAGAMGMAIRALHIRISTVWCSPTYRALETARLAGLPAPRKAAELGDNGASMQATTSDQAAWLQAKVAEPSRSGADTFIITQAPNITAAFGQEAAGLSDGEALIFHPSGSASPDLVARIKIEDWPTLHAPS